MQDNNIIYDISKKKIAYLSIYDYIYFILNITGLSKNDIEHLIKNNIPLKTPYSEDNVFYDYMYISNNEIVVIVCNSSYSERNSRKTRLINIFSINTIHDRATKMNVFLSDSYIEYILYEENKKTVVKHTNISENTKEKLFNFFNNSGENIDVNVYYYSNITIIDFIAFDFKKHNLNFFEIDKLKLKKTSFLKNRNVITKKTKSSKIVSLLFLLISFLIFNTSIFVIKSNINNNMILLNRMTQTINNKERLRNNLLNNYLAIKTDNRNTGRTPYEILEILSQCADSSLSIDSFFYTQTSFNISGTVKSSLQLLNRLENIKPDFTYTLSNIQNNEGFEIFTINGKFNE